MRHTVVREHLIDYPTPITFTYLWSFGSLAGLFLSIQVISGVLLAMHYTPHVVYAFASVEHIMRDVNNGWLLRYVHANGASFVFFMLYIHVAKAIYYNSYTYPFANLWRIGMVLFILMMATAFMGYVLPWGQMSFWGATVITNLFTAIPFVGEHLVYLLWGGYSVDNATLNRFFSLHFLLPFLIVGLVGLHLVLLHLVGSSNPLKIESSADKLPFYPYFYFKDLVALLVVFCFFSLFVFFYPNALGHSDNYIEANALSTPSHIVPEWYFLPFYAILRSIPNKLGGVIAMGLALVVVLLVPSIFYTVRIFFPLLSIVVLNPKFRPFARLFFSIFAGVMLLLGWIGQMPVEVPYILIGMLTTGFYFIYFLFLVPGLYLVEIWFFLVIIRSTFVASK